MTLKYEAMIKLCHQYDTVYTMSIDYREHGVLHRTDAPARIWDDGDHAWYQYGSYHRVGGPARCIKSQGWAEYYHRGEFYDSGVDDERYGIDK